jgi:hypothetical protein
MTEFPISLDALVRRVGRKVSRHGERLTKARAGAYRVLDRDGKLVREMDTAELIEFARTLGVLKEHEHVAGGTP